ncbi:marine proteobacterial sortase target protein [Ketobacter alkanivorans]|uniref:Marine proteobacterial sortase target protein n=1 Tax=Ketobacter alkanivorans TaxID=1917421 RepID=A0A2K9LIP1_9GAMM|nr:marine proteobacterial sortase target protein [Ketobacter alkanivorans]AUM12110.1 marine proteobacterial sortase target protein [Ketobacter alkanivorans]
MQRKYSLLCLFFAFCLLWTSSRSFGFEEADYASLDEVGTGSLLVKEGHSYRPFLRSNAEFDVQVNGLVSKVIVRQSFRNPGQDWVEAVYVLPLPDDSAVNAMRIKIGERVIEGEIKEKQEAKRIYTQAKAAGKRAGLLQQQRPNLFSTQVANIGPGETVEVELSFLQVLHYDGGQFSLRLPLTLTPRYIPGVSLMELPPQEVKGWSFPTAQVPDAHLITPPQTHQAQTPEGGDDQLKARIQIAVNTGFDVERFSAPYHAIDVTRLSAEYRVSTQSGAVPMDRDFVLNWKPVAQQAPVAAYFSEQVEGKDHGLIMLLPPTQSQNLQIGPRELIMIIDSSGSMSGQSMVQAKQAVQMALDRLRPQDRFNVIDFDSGFNTLFPASAHAEPGALRRARLFVDSLVADGGTAMYAPLQAALTGPDSEENVTQVVFITDGSVGNEAALFELIHKHIGSKRLYTVGIGSAPNAYFMRKAAEFGRGTYTYIGSSDEVQGKMSELFGKIEKPALTHLNVNIEGAQAELYPQPVPDLYLGEPLVIKARFDEQPERIQISGMFEGQPWRSQLQLQQGDSATGVATLWARSKVAHLQDEGVRQGNGELHRDEIIKLGIEHRLVTRYTSFVAVDKTPVRPADADLLTDQVANRMPAGSTQPAPAVGYPRTALGLHWHLLMGLMLLILALLVWHRAEFREECHGDLA